MPYCSHCGRELPEGALFCPNCGAKTPEGVKSNAVSASDEVRDVFNKASVELEKAFTIAAKEIREAFQTARSNIQKNVNKEPIVCPKCGEKNPANADYCFKCGTKLSSSSSK